LAHRLATPLYAFGTEPAGAVSAHWGNDRLRCGFAFNHMHLGQKIGSEHLQLSAIDPYCTLIRSGQVVADL
jgi:hypothetical protein